jgi:hypothetical protein
VNTRLNWQLGSAHLLKCEECMNLFKTFTDLEKKDDSYYYTGIKHIEPITHPEKAWCFIEEYFKAGEKQSALNVKDIENLKMNGKHLHTVSMYFIGILLRKMFEKTIKNKLDNLLLNHGSEYVCRYTYTWFITCLFHDFSWIHEDDKISKDYLDLEGCFLINLLNKFDINSTLLE